METYHISRFTCSEIVSLYSEIRSKKLSENSKIP